MLLNIAPRVFIPYNVRERERERGFKLPLQSIRVLVLNPLGEKRLGNKVREYIAMRVLLRPKKASLAPCTLLFTRRTSDAAPHFLRQLALKSQTELA